MGRKILFAGIGGCKCIGHKDIGRSCEYFNVEWYHIKTSGLRKCLHDIRLILSQPGYGILDIVSISAQNPETTKMKERRNHGVVMADRQRWKYHSRQMHDLRIYIDDHFRNTGFGTTRVYHIQTADKRLAAGNASGFRIVGSLR